MFDAEIQAFENAWRGESAPDISLFLPPDLPAEIHRSLLIELIAVDISMRSTRDKNGRPLPFDAYFLKFPELGAVEGAPLDLIAEQYRAQRRRGESPAQAAFAGRFGDRREGIAAMLKQIDEELRLEGDEPLLERHSRRARFVIPPIQIDPALVVSHRDFTLERLIGAGGEGKVYRARRNDGQIVAIKHLRKAFLREPGAVSRFIAEGRAACELRHPRIVGASGVGVTAAGACFIVMDLIDGRDLAKVLSRGTINAHDAVQWIISACEAIHAAHEQGIIHCDLKPANLLLDNRGEIFVTDFGLARRLDEIAAPRAGIGGTAPFMAPEQVCDSWGEIGPQTDVYGLGAVLFTLLAGRPPYLGPSAPDVLSQVASSNAAPSLADLRPDFPAPVCSAIAQALSKHPNARFATPLAFSAALGTG